MKKILVLIVFFACSLSVSAHQDAKRFDTDFTVTPPNALYTPVYTASNGGFIQLIYNLFTKVGEVIYTSTHKEEASVATQKEILLQD